MNVAGTLIDTLIASNRGDRNAFAFGEKRYSYQDVAALMNRAANMLRGMGVRPGERVLVLLPGSPALVASLLGAVKSGAVPVLGAPADDGGALQRCAAASTPAAAVVHQSCLASAADALAALAADTVIVVGNDVQGHKSFVDSIRGQSSWFAAEPIDGDAPAIAVWSGSSLRTISHAQLAAMLDGEGATDAEAGIASTVAMLRAFSHGEVATLP
jgi:acyl-coenzyme A synthetase/AMP-(fatty) acid ligase